MKKIKSLCCLLALICFGITIPSSIVDAQCNGTIFQFCTPGTLGDCVPLTGGTTGFECQPDLSGGDCAGVYLKCLPEQ